MKVTYHATKRFLERVLHKAGYSRQEFYETKRKLEEMFMSVVPGSYARSFALPNYKGYKVIHQGNTVITIIEKNTKNSGRRKCAYSPKPNKLSIRRSIPLPETTSSVN